MPLHHPTTPPEWFQLGAPPCLSTTPPPHQPPHTYQLAPARSPVLSTTFSTRSPPSSPLPPVHPSCPPLLSTLLSNPPVHPSPPPRLCCLPTCCGVKPLVVVSLSSEWLVSRVGESIWRGWVGVKGWGRGGRFQARLVALSPSPLLQLRPHAPPAAPPPAPCPSTGANPAPASWPPPPGPRLLPPPSCPRPPAAGPRTRAPRSQLPPPSAHPPAPPPPAPISPPGRLLGSPPPGALRGRSGCC